jgi:GTP-binding protein
LIEGAAEGAGLGDEFLAHVERCRALVHVVEVAPPEGAPDPAEAYDTVRGELAAYGAGLDRLPELLVLSKRDLLPEDQVDEAVERFRERLADRGLGILAVSSATGAGLEVLRTAILDAVPEEPVPTAPADEPEFEAEHITYRPAAEQGYAIEREGEAFRVAGRGVEMLIARHDLSNHEALAYLEQRLTEMGVVAALRSAGFEPGDEVRIGDEAFELDPG